MMASKRNRTCKVCGESYYFCTSCSHVPATEKYKTMFCAKNCRDIFHTCSCYNVGAIDKTTAKSRLSILDLSNRNNFSSQIKTDLSNILKAKTKTAKKEVVLVEEVITTEEPIVEIQSEKESTISDEAIVEEQII